MKSIHALAAAASLLCGGLLVAPALAHHSSAMFDDGNPLILKGKVTRFDYLNPHSWLYVEIENEDGTTTEWGFELEAPPRLRRMNVGPNHWVEGDSVTLRTHPLRDGRPAGALEGAVKEDGTPFGDIEGLTPAAAQE